MGDRKIKSIPSWDKDYQEKLCLELRRFLHNKTGSRKYLLGLCMRELRGQANPNIIIKVIDDIIKNRETAKNKQESDDNETVY